MKFTDEQIEFMRADIESSFAYSKLIHIAKKIVESEGLNFEEEFEKWKINQRRK